MLVLDRRIREEIVIIDNETGEQIIVVPTRIEENQVKIGIKASDRYQVLRREVLERDRATPPA